MVTYNLALYATTYAKLEHTDPETQENLPFTFAKFPFQMEMFADMFPKVVIKKALQVGASEYAILKSIHACDKLRASVMYGFPHSRQIGRFSKTRISPLLNRSPYFKGLCNSADGSRANQSTFLREIRGKFFYLVGVASDSEIQSESVDMVIRDERDLMDQNNAEVLLKRNKASLKKMNLDLGFPTVEGFGIDEEFQRSDQREYEVRCEWCGEWQEIQWPRNVNRELRQRVCWKCGKSIERSLADFRCGRWVARNPKMSSICHGYHIHTLLYPGMDFEEFFQDADNVIRIQEFYNFQLGLAYSQKGVRIDEGTFMACVDESAYFPVPKPQRAVFGGVDVGKVLHCWFEEVTIRNGKVNKNLVDAKVFSGENKFEDLMAYILDLQPVAVCIDVYPEITEVSRLVKKFRGTVWALSFQDFTSNPQDEAKLDTENTFFLAANRTMLLDWNAEDFINRAVRIPGEALAQHPDIKEHFKALIRVTDRIGRTEVPINRWTTPVGKPDHWAFARAASIAASKLEEWLVQEGARITVDPTEDTETDWRADYDSFRRKLR